MNGVLLRTPYLVLPSLMVVVMWCMISGSGVRSTKSLQEPGGAQTSAHRHPRVGEQRMAMSLVHCRGRLLLQDIRSIRAYRTRAPMDHIDAIA